MGYYNNSNRGLTKAYEETLDAQKDIQAKTICEEMGRSTAKATGIISEHVNKLLLSLEGYSDEMSEDPERFSGFVKNIKAERDRVNKARLAAIDIQRALNKLEEAISAFDIDF